MNALGLCYVGLLLGLVFLQDASAQAARILLDGQYDDWAAVSPQHIDPTGDVSAGHLDLARVWVTNDEQFLFLRFELGVETLIQEGNALTLYLDTDDDPATGQPAHGIGAELVWTFGQRTGVFIGGGVSRTLTHHAFGIVTAPTVSATGFEMAFDRAAMPDGQHRLFPDATLRLVLEDATGGDRLPDATGGVAYTVADASSLPPLAVRSLGKQAPGDVRVLSYNVERDALFDPGRQPSFVRLLRAIEPEIIGFQEILGHTATQTAAVVEVALPSAPGQAWYAERIDPDLIVVSRYPVRRSFRIPGGNTNDANAAFVLDMQDQWGTDLFLLVAHPPCCRNDLARQQDIDAMMAFVRDAKEAGGVLTLDPGTPIIVVGDMNLVGFAEQLSTLVAGTIVDTGRFGPAFAPDWDGSAFVDLAPRHVALPMTFTWYRETSPFHPGRLDYIVYSDAVLEAGNRFVLFTPSMPSDSLMAYRLEPDDATVASDHLPVIGDFRYAPSTGTALDDEAPATQDAFGLLPNYPNPFYLSTQITYDLPVDESVRLVIYDGVGREVAVLSEGYQPAGRHRVKWEADGFPNGLYFYRLQAGKYHFAQAMLLLR